MATKAILQQIQKNGQLAFSKAGYLGTSAETFGPQRTVQAFRPVTMGIAAKPATPIRGKSTMVKVGDQPDGFGKIVLWNESDNAMALIVFLNPADPLGVMITGVKATDVLRVISATGIASFSQETANEGLSSIIGIVQAGAEVLTTVFGAPEVAPLIEAGANYAKEHFKEEKVRTKRRDPFGEDPGTGHKAKQEGGVIISLPEAGKIFYSGNEDHRERWIKEPGIRDGAHHPSHVSGAFFLRGRDTAVAGADGDIFISAWDHLFEDNIGTYRLHLLLNRGNGVFPPEK